MFEYTCRYCGVTFESRRPPHDPHAPHYCSTQCVANARRKHEPRQCIVCGKTFTPTKSETKHCSKACVYVTHRSRAETHCVVCGKPFRRNHRSRKYCSQHCYGTTMLGQHPRKGKEFSRSTRRAIKARDGYRCVICGSDDRIQIDHIIPASLGGDNSLANGQVLCINCHREKSRRQRSEIVHR